MFVVTLTNESCKIKIVSVHESGASLGTVTSIVIKRRESGDVSWTTIKTISLTDISGLDYTFFDKYTKSRRTYEYQFVPMSGITAGTAVEKSIECNFDVTYITDFTTEYNLFLNKEIEFDDHGSETVQELMNSRTPIILRNGVSDYLTGYVDALPLPLDANGNPTLLGAHKYKEQFILFLKNRKDKYLKTEEGDALLVYIHEPPKRNKAELEGSGSIRFSFTEIGDAPTHDES